MPETTYFKTTQQFYKDSSLTVDKPTYLLIVKTFFLILSQELIKRGKVIKLPFHMGILGILKKRPSSTSNKPKNYAIFNETGDSIPLTNLHSAGYIARLLWKKTYPYSEPFIQRAGVCFKFRPARSFNRSLAAHIKSNNIFQYYDNN